MSTNDEDPTPTAGTVPEPEAARAAQAAPTAEAGWTATDLYAPTTSTASSRPHVRWGGIVWGAILVAISGFVLFIVSSHARQVAFDAWVAGLTPGGFWTLAVIAVGVFILILALLAVVRSAQRK